MAVSSYEKDGKVFWRVYLDLRSKRNPRIRAQKRINGLLTEREAIAAERQLLRKLSEEVVRQENQGSTWSEVIDAWIRQQENYPTKQYAPTTIIDYSITARKWTETWLGRVASELNRADGRSMDQFAVDSGKSSKFRKNLKAIVNRIYNWGIEERLIVGVNQSPVYGLEIDRDREEKRPEILTRDEIRILLRKAKEQKHPWYPFGSRQF